MIITANGGFLEMMAKCYSIIQRAALDLMSTMTCPMLGHERHNMFIPMFL